MNNVKPCFEYIWAVETSRKHREGNLTHGELKQSILDKLSGPLCFGPTGCFTLGQLAATLYYTDTELGFSVFEKLLHCELITDPSKKKLFDTIWNQCFKYNFILHGNVYSSFEDLAKLRKLERVQLDFTLGNQINIHDRTLPTEEWLKEMKLIANKRQLSDDNWANLSFELKLRLKDTSLTRAMCESLGPLLNYLRTEIILLLLKQEYDFKLSEELGDILWRAFKTPQKIDEIDFEIPATILELSRLRTNEALHQTIQKYLVWQNRRAQIAALLPQYAPYLAEFPLINHQILTKVIEANDDQEYSQNFTVLHLDTSENLHKLKQVEQVTKVEIKRLTSSTAAELPTLPNLTSLILHFSNENVEDLVLILKSLQHLKELTLLAADDVKNGDFIGPAIAHMTKLTFFKLTAPTTEEIILSLAGLTQLRTIRTGQPPKPAEEVISFPVWLRQMICKSKKCDEEEILKGLRQSDYQLEEASIIDAVKLIPKNSSYIILNILKDEMSGEYEQEGFNKLWKYMPRIYFRPDIDLKTIDKYLYFGRVQKTPDLAYIFDDYISEKMDHMRLKEAILFAPFFHFLPKSHDRCNRYILSTYGTENLVDPYRVFLTHLSLDWDRDDLQQKFPHLTSLIVSTCTEEIMKMKQLTAFKVRYADNLRTFLEQNTQLTHLTCGIDDSYADVISKLTNLTYLNLRNAKVTNAILPALCKLTKLTTLNLRETKVTRENLAQLAILPELEELHVDPL